MNELRQLLDKISSIVTKNNQILDATGGRFNIFQIIGVTTDETRLHSAFINELLHAKGSHGLGDLPLKAFIKHCLNDSFNFETTTSKSQVEISIGSKSNDEGGRIDILVTNECNQSIIIENKIYAGDQDLQMLRYYNYSKKFSASKLIYLTLDGKAPSEYSTGSNNFDCITISYKFEIINWLTECKMLAIDFPLVREAISHYINLIKHLTNTSIMAEMNHEIVELVMQTPQNVQMAFEIEKALTEVKINIQWKFWEQLEKSLVEKGLIPLDEDHRKRVTHSKVKSYYGNARSKETNFGLCIELFNEDGNTIQWVFEVQQDRPYFGFILEKYGKGGISSLEENRKYRQLVTECDELFRTDDEYWLGWQYVSPELLFSSFNTQTMYNLADDKYCKSISDEIAEKAYKDITYFLANAIS